MRVKVPHSERPWIYDVDLDGGKVWLRQCPSSAISYMTYWQQEDGNAYLPIKHASGAFISELPPDYVEWLPDQ